MTNRTSTSSAGYEVDIPVPVANTSNVYGSAQYVLEMEVYVSPEGPLINGDVLVVNVSASHNDRSARVLTDVSCIVYTVIGPLFCRMSLIS